jgi:hypothetical protein
MPLPNAANGGFADSLSFGHRAPPKLHGRTRNAQARRDLLIFDALRRSFFLTSFSLFDAMPNWRSLTFGSDHNPSNILSC